MSDIVWIVVLLVSVGGCYLCSEYGCCDDKPTGAAAAGGMKVAVTCPAGVGPGGTLQVANPSTGQNVNVVVPAGVQPGQTFNAMMPAIQATFTAAPIIASAPVAQPAYVQQAPQMAVQMGQPQMMIQQPQMVVAQPMMQGQPQMVMAQPQMVQAQPGMQQVQMAIPMAKP